MFKAVLLTKLSIAKIIVRRWMMREWVWSTGAMIHEREKSKYLVKNLPYLHFHYHKSHMKSLGSIPKHSFIDISDIRPFV
jgi:hypothetical protein